ncbi:hypothetical protein FA13DRAFT_132074 [Coprinellus micaceus]|uniref:Uncharacterized protein n=1 Tax=Coprinellus micaceus TaxID=71717 RepID=A0A4Y7SI01_COPMI|nr:hypothetical protein FA13DRAFT_132074 [Coprinellus micaceus]
MKGPGWALFISRAEQGLNDLGIPAPSVHSPLVPGPKSDDDDGAPVALRAIPPCFPSLPFSFQVPPSCFYPPSLLRLPLLPIPSSAAFSSNPHSHPITLRLGTIVVVVPSISDVSLSYRICPYPILTFAMSSVVPFRNSPGRNILVRFFGRSGGWALSMCASTVGSEARRGHGVVRGARRRVFGSREGGSPELRGQDRRCFYALGMGGGGEGM